MEKFKQIEEAKNFLEEQGFFTENLWHIEDVKQKFNCTDEQAQSILKKALSNEATMEQIRFAIKLVGEDEGLKPVEG